MYTLVSWIKESGTGMVSTWRTTYMWANGGAGHKYNLNLKILMVILKCNKLSGHIRMYIHIHLEQGIIRPHLILLGAGSHAVN